MKATPETIKKGDVVLWIKSNGIADFSDTGIVVDVDPRFDEEPDKSYGGRLVKVVWGDDELSLEDTHRLEIVES